MPLLVASSVSLSAQEEPATPAAPATPASLSLTIDQAVDYALGQQQECGLRQI
ncbi:MAG: hypothetical protein MZV63_53955 [Marinilabiliales bacterium]|nr:hypothetical protein [Marinilabiliales bacterium]